LNLVQQELIQLKYYDDSENMTEMLERALAPLLIFGSFFGLGIFEYPRGQPRIYLSCLYVLAKWGSFTYFFYYPEYIWHSQNNDYFIDDFLLFILITSILIGFCHFKEKL